MRIEKKKIKEKFLDIFFENKDKIFIVDAFCQKTYTFGEFLNLSLKAGAFLKENRVEAGDKIIYMLPNSLEAAVFYFASIFIGAIAVPINPSFHSRDIEFITKNVTPKLIVSTEEIILKIKNILPREKIVVIKGINGKMEWSIVDGSDIFTLNKIKNNDLIRPFEGVMEDDPCAVVIYTSGTTARPKGVVRSLSDFINNAVSFCEELDINGDNRFLNILPMTYLGGYYNLLLLPFSIGASVVIWENFGPKTPLFFWDIVEKYKVNTLWFVPTIMAIMLAIDRTDKSYELCQKIIKRALVGTAPLPNVLKKRFEDKYGIKLYENYGLSETLFISTDSPRYVSAEKSVGRVIDEIEVIIKNEQGSIMPVNKEGEIWVKTPYLMTTYYSINSEDPNMTDGEGFFPTGDIGCIAPRGELFITGRKKDLIIKGGVNISPKAIEDRLCEYSCIEESAVIGIPHDIYGEDIAVVLKMSKGSSFEEEIPKIKEFCKENLASIQVPSHFFEIEEIPKGLTGKVQKYRIKDILLAKMGFSRAGDEKASTNVFSRNKSITVLSKVRTEIKRPTKEIISMFKKFPTSVISDCLNRLRVMKDIKSLVKGRPFVGPAFTVEEVEGANLMSHIALEYIKEGDVLVIDGKGVNTRSCWGGLQTKCAEKRKVAGIVINGVVRDLNDIEDSNMPVYCLGVSPAGPLKGWGGFVNFSINCSGVSVSPGDIVIGDDDGVVVVALEFAEEVLKYCKMRLEREKKWFKMVEEGKTTIEVVKLEEQIKKFNIEFINDKQKEEIR